MATPASGSSSHAPDSWDSVIACTSVLGPFQIFHYRHRTMTKYRPLPVIWFRLDECQFKVDLPQKLFTDGLEKMAQRLAMKILGCNKKSAYALFRLRASPNNYTDVHPTIVVFVKEKRTAKRRSQWSMVVEEIKKQTDKLMSETPKANNLDIAVEMVWQEVTAPKYCCPLDKDDEQYPQIEQAWPLIQGHVADIAEKYPEIGTYINTIALFKLGTNRWSRSNTKTVYVSVSYKSPELNWPPAQKEIQGYLDEVGLGLRLHLEHNEVNHQPFGSCPVDELVPAEDDQMRYEYNPNSNDSYSSHLSPGAGIEITVEQTQTGIREAKVVGLTNYHIARPAIDGFAIQDQAKKTFDNKAIVRSTPATKPLPDSELQRADEFGFSHQSGKTYAKMEHPPCAYHELNLSMLTDTLNLKDDRVPWHIKPMCQKMKTVSEEFVAGGKHILGELYLGSGFSSRTRTNGRLDFALVLPSNDAEMQRIGPNKLKSAGKNRQSVVHDNLTFNVLFSKYEFHLQTWSAADGLPLSDQPEGKSIHNMVAGDPLFKMGASSAETIGHLTGGIKSTIRIAEDAYLEGQRFSSEYTIIGLKQLPRYHNIAPFGLNGYNGPVVWDRKGCLLGLLFASIRPQCTNDGLSFVTLIEDVFEEIKRVSGLYRETEDCVIVDVSVKKDPVTAEYLQYMRLTEKVEGQR
ncbi:hypothetical protein V8F33_006067 [Rhypophila sp. PSN 637]